MSITRQLPEKFRPNLDCDRLWGQPCGEKRDPNGPLPGGVATGDRPPDAADQILKFKRFADDFAAQTVEF